MALEFSISPLYGQVSVHDVGTADLPEWRTGDEPAVWSAHAVLVATRPDSAGTVSMIVAAEPYEAAGDEGEVFAGELFFNGPEFEVGNIVAGDLRRVPLTRNGPLRVRVLAAPPGHAARVSCVLPAGSLADQH